MIEVRTPAGIGIRYQPETEGKRTYWVSEQVSSVGVWLEVPSVTQVLDILDKPALPWWGMRVGFRAIHELIIRHELLQGVNRWLVKDDDGIWQEASWEDKGNVERAIVRNRLSTNHVRDEGGVRGQAAHDAFEAWSRTAARAAPTGYPAYQAPYVEAFLKFAEDASVTDVSTEVMVASVVHRWAGRYDLDCKITGEFWNGIGNRASKTLYEAVPALLDAKTSKYVYPNHFVQLEAYEGGRIECGYAPTDVRLVLHLMGDGRYQVKESSATYEAFTSLRAAYDYVG